MMTALATFLSLNGAAADPVRFLIGFVLLVCVVACVIILVRWLAALAQWTVPQPLMVVAGIIIFMIGLLWILSWSGIYHW